MSRSSANANDANFDEGAGAAPRLDGLVESVGEGLMDSSGCGCFVLDGCWI